MKIIYSIIFFLISTLNISSQDMLVSSCDSLGGSWKIFKKKEFNFDSLNNQETVFTYRWNDFKNEFFPTMKEVEYWVSKDCKINYGFNWSFQQQDYELSSNGLEYYDSLGNLVLEFFDQIDETSILGARNQIKHIFTIIKTGLSKLN